MDLKLEICLNIVKFNIYLIKITVKNPKAISPIKIMNQNTVHRKIKLKESIQLIL